MKYSICFKGKEDYTGTQTKSFKLGKVTNVKVKAKKTSAGKTYTVKWKKVKGANEYRIYYSKKKNGKYKPVDQYNVSTNSNTFIINTKKKLYFKVSAINRYLSSGIYDMCGPLSSPSAKK